MHEIKGSASFTKIEPIQKGWSSDQKYYVETKTGTRLLLRISDSFEYERKQHEFDMMKDVALLNLPTLKPLEIGMCNNGKSVYLPYQAGIWD